jgi:hypothetical protein
MVDLYRLVKLPATRHVGAVRGSREPGSHGVLANDVRALEQLMAALPSGGQQAERRPARRSGLADRDARVSCSWPQQQSTRARSQSRRP